MMSMEFRAGILHAAQMLRDEAAAATGLSDGARRLCLTDMAEKLEAEAAKRDVRLRPTAAAAEQVQLF